MRMKFLFILFYGFICFTGMQAQNNTATKDNDPVYPTLGDDQMAVFPGGPDSMQAFLSRNLSYPPLALMEKAEGKVWVTFVVRKTGKITDIKILKPGRKDLDEEALRVVKMMPDWKPGHVNNKPVSVQYNLPVFFKMTDKRPEGVMAPKK